jgi:hypothetical protein
MGFDVILSHQLRNQSDNKKDIGFAPFAQHKGKMMSEEKSFELARILRKITRFIFLEVEKKKAKSLPDGKANSQYP